MILLVLHKTAAFDFNHLNAEVGESKQHKVPHKAAKFAIDWSRRDDVGQVAEMWQFVVHTLRKVADTN